MKIKFIKFQKEKIFGYSKQKFRGKYLFIAAKEKAIVDSLYLPEQCPISETFEALQDKDVDIQKLIDNKINETINKFSWSKKQIEIKYIDVAVQTYYPIVYTEVYSGTRKFDGRRFGRKIEDVAGPELLRRIFGGAEISRAEYEGRYYKKALQVKELIKEEFEKAFKTVDCIIVPTCPGLPWKIGESMNLEEVYAYDALTIPANLAEICAISIPAGKINGIPVGLQIFCGKGQESKMLSIAREIESLK